MTSQEKADLLLHFKRLDQSFCATGQATNSSFTPLPFPSIPGIIPPRIKKTHNIHQILEVTPIATGSDGLTLS